MKTNIEEILVHFQSWQLDQGFLNINNLENGMVSKYLKSFDLSFRNEEIGNMENLLKQFEEKIKSLQDEKLKYREQDDQYSWHVVDNEQKVWEEAKKMAENERDKGAEKVTNEN